MKVVLNRSSFDSVVNILELNTGIKITFVVERMNSKLLKKDFDEMKFVFSVGLNDVDLTKLNILSQDELIGVVE